MDIERANQVLIKAIVGLQEGELAAMAEATIGGYKVPSPGDLAKKSKKRSKQAKCMAKYRNKKGDFASFKDCVQAMGACKKVRDPEGMCASMMFHKSKAKPKQESLEEATAVGRTSYEVPAPGHHPGGVGPAPKKVRKPKLAAKWTSGSFDMMRSTGTPDPVPAHLFGVWAVHKKGTWLISHAPTGMSAFTGFEAKDDARAAVEKMIEEFPSLLTVGKDAELGEGDEVVAKMNPHLSRIKQLVRQVKGRGGWEHFNKKMAAKASRQKKALKAVEAVGNRWVKAAFLKTTTRGKLSEPTAAAMRGVWAVHKAENEPGTPKWQMEKGWTISHAPTGYRVFWEFGTQKDAKAAVDKIIDFRPELILMAKSGGEDAARKQLRQYHKDLEKIARQHGGR
jgi:hypothetical protein